MEQNVMEWFTDADDRHFEDEVAKQPKDKNDCVPVSERYIEYLFAKRHLGSECCGEILSFGESDGFNYEMDGRETQLTGTVGCELAKRNNRQIASNALLLNEPTVGTLRTHKDGEGFREMQSNVAPTLNARARQDGSQQGVISISTKQQGGPKYSESRAFCLGANDYKEPQSVQLADRRIRRLTPVECMRLQGFPDDHCDVGINEKSETYAISDTGKYQCAGNAVTTNVIEAIITKMLEKGCLQ